MSGIRRFLAASVMLVVVLVSSFASGCGDDGPPLVPVSGVVTKNGEPLADAELTFTPDPSNQFDTIGNDVTGPDGKYRARHRGKYGLSVGKYVVSISQRKPTQDLSKLPKEIMIDPVQQAMAGLTKESLPKDFAEGTNKTLVMEVTAPKTEYDFDVKQATDAMKKGAAKKK